MSGKEIVATRHVPATGCPENFLGKPHPVFVWLFSVEVTDHRDGTFTVGYEAPTRMMPFDRFGPRAAGSGEF